MSRAVVFAYHNVGVRCLSVLLDAGVDVALVVTHQDAREEHIWFDSVIACATRNNLPYITPEDPNTANIIKQIAALQPDFIFSFYYRHMLKPTLLAIPTHGAYNMHGSLLPHYRGRVPVNWAIIHGEKQTGATLHIMTEKPDAGDIVAQTAVPILQDDLAIDVFHKVVCAAEHTLHRVLPALLAGTAPTIAQDIRLGSYFSGRRPEHGRIDWMQSARHIHNLIRAVAPPYPGAFSTLLDQPLRVLRSRVIDDFSPAHAKPVFFCDNHAFYVHCGGGGTLQLLELEWAGQTPSALNCCDITAGQTIDLV